MQESFAPGRVELLGNHTDYNEGVVLSAALELGVTAKGSRREDSTILMRTTESPAPVKASVERLAPIGQWQDYPLGVASEFLKAGFPVGGFEMDFSSTLPSGAGLSSSAAMEVATGLLLMKLFGITLDPLELAKLCRKAENEFVGVNCGLLDQATSVFGQKQHAVFLDCRSETVDCIPFPKKTGLLIVNSGVKHALTGGEYNERRAMCFQAAKAIGVPALRDTDTRSLEAADLPEIVRRRARHIVDENSRVFAALTHLRAGDATNFGKLMTQSHESSRTNFENSTPELDLLVDLAIKQPSIHGARLTGGGFGGAIVAIGESDLLQDAGTEICDRYKRETGHKATPLTCLPGDGAWRCADLA